MSVVKERGMVGTYKAFDNASHKRNDKKGRDAFREFCNRHYPLQTIDNPNIHGIDLLTMKDGKVVIAWDVEVREDNWKGDVPFPERFARDGGINCLERKEYMWRKEKKLTNDIPFELDPKCKVYYVQLNDVCTRAVVIDGDIVLSRKLVPWKNRLKEGEYVRQVPLELTIQVKLYK